MGAIARRAEAFCAIAVKVPSKSAKASTHDISGAGQSSRNCIAFCCNCSICVGEVSDPE